MRAVEAIFLIVIISGTSGSLLEMSQSLWTKVLEGGLTKFGVLDPLRVPVVKVDQSEGETSYRIVLRDVEIIGLNSSSLESVHIGRGRLRTNLSEHEAGYVSYTDQHELDTIRYRFHTLVKGPKGEKSENLEVRPISDLEKSSRDGNRQGVTRDYARFSSRRRDNSETSSSYRDNQAKTSPQIDGTNYESSSRYVNEHRDSQAHRSNYEMPERRQDQTRYHTQLRNSPSFENFKMASQTPQQEEMAASPATSKFFGVPENSRNPAETKSMPGRVRVVYAERQRDYPVNNYHSTNQRFMTEHAGTSACPGNCAYRKNKENSRIRTNEQREDLRTGQDEEIGAAASMNFESRRAYVDEGSKLGRNPEISAGERSRNDGSMDDRRYAETFNERVDKVSRNGGRFQQNVDSSLSQRIENQPGYVDIVYADEKNKKIRHFGNLRVEPGHDTTVYSLDDVLRDLRDHKRFIIHNFTDGESLTKKNDAIRTASETKRIKDLVRYAKDFQEKQGYYEQGMQLIYHYGGREDDSSIKDKEGRRTKRAHLDEEAEDDVMHVIMRIRVPMLRVNAGYVLTGKIGKQVLRGNGLLAANFTELIGDFTLELKKVDDDTMIVRTARAKLSAGHKKITLQGMEEEGPVNEILTQGLMAAEAVAAMLADDLTTKALSEKTADSIIYKMYKNLPTGN